MKKIVALMAILFAIVLHSAHAEEGKSDETELANFIELVQYRGGDSEAIFCFEKELGNDFAVDISGAITRGLKEFAVSTAYYLTPQMEVGIGLGMSQYASATEDVASFHQLISSFYYWKTEKVETSVVVQNYARDPKPWYGKAYTQFKVTDNFLVGAYTETGVGAGPRVSYAFSKNVNVWAIPLIKRRGNSTLVMGVQFLF